MEYYIGIDVGGTSIKAGILNMEKKILAKDSISADAGQSGSRLVENMAKLAKSLPACIHMGMDEVRGIGVGIPGTVNSRTGKISFVNNLQLNGFPVKEELERLLSCPVTVCNDGDAAAYGESIAGAGRGFDHILMLTLGTGLGGGFISEGKIFSGADRLGGEFGHTGIVFQGEPCTCGRRGCLEAYVSATGLIRMTREAMQRYPESLMWDLAPDLALVDGQTVFDAAQRKDVPAMEVLDSYTDYLAYGIANYVCLFAPDAVILGGGISAQGERLTQIVSEKTESELHGQGRLPQIVCAELKNDAGIIGAAFLGHSYENLDKFSEKRLANKKDL